MMDYVRGPTPADLEQPRVSPFVVDQVRTHGWQNNYEDAVIQLGVLNFYENPDVNDNEQWEALSTQYLNDPTSPLNGLDLSDVTAVSRVRSQLMEQVRQEREGPIWTAVPLAVRLNDSIIANANNILRGR